MEKQIVDFIQRRFPMDCAWMNGNCFYFAQILASRFVGEIVYDPIEGHFCFGLVIIIFMIGLVGVNIQ